MVLTKRITVCKINGEISPIKVVRKDMLYHKPLIKDKNIRNAVYAWAVACGVSRVNFTQGCVFQYGWFSIDFGDTFDDSLMSGHYTIFDLCGKNIFD